MQHDLAQSGLKGPCELACRSCGSRELRPILSLGRTPLANRLIEESQLDQPEPTYALDLVLCPACSLVQITETVPPEQLFSEYAYFSSYSDTMLAHAGELSRQLIGERQLTADSLVVEIASNDGYLLQYYLRAGIPVLGIEPASNIARVATNERGIPTLNQFFTRELGEQLARQNRRADVLHAHNVLAHVADLNGTVAGMHALLSPLGIAVIEAPYIKPLLEGAEFDTIYHEHLCYFSLMALDRLFARNGLTIVDVERLPIHGGSLRIFAARSGVQSSRVRNLLAEEQAWGVDQIAAYQQFGQRVERLKSDLLALLHNVKQSGKRIAVYGASAKGSTLLNYYGIGRDLIDFVVDRSPVKQGRFTPGTHLRIHSPDKLAEEQPDYCLLLSWNLADEILHQQTKFRQAGGKFIIPIPELKVA
jgi:hypothetical protein